MKPWLSVQYVIPPEKNGEFVFAMERVLSVYSRPYDPAYPVVCMDEKPVQMLKDLVDPEGPKPGKPRRINHSYQRMGVANIFIAVEALAGKRIVRVTHRRTKKDWAKFLKEISDLYPDAKKITLVMDNLNTHNGGSLYETFTPEFAGWLVERFEFIYTPKRGSWLNIAELELSALARQCLSRRIKCMELLRSETKVWQDERNAKVVKINWQFKNSDARIKLKRLYPVIEE